MTLNEVLDALRTLRVGARAVVVTGPQRSGTTIAVRILAAEFGYRYVDEEEFGIHDTERAKLLLARGNCVLQAPGLCHTAHTLGVPVVMMRRIVEDIRESEDRIGWREKYGGANLRIEQHKYALRFGIYGDNIALIKYYCWDNLQKQYCTSFDLDYESLRGHPLWKEKEERQEFTARQTQ